MSTCAYSSHNPYHQYASPTFASFNFFSLRTIGDILADLILIVVPLKLLWQLDKSCPQRRRLLVVFSSSIITTITSLIHSYYILRVGGFITLFMGLIEVRTPSFLPVHRRFVLTDDIFHIFRSALRSSFATSPLWYLSSAALSAVGDPDHTHIVRVTLRSIGGATETTTR